MTQKWTSSWICCNWWCFVWLSHNKQTTYYQTQITARKEFEWADYHLQIIVSFTIFPKKRVPYSRFKGLEMIRSGAKRTQDANACRLQTLKGSKQARNWFEVVAQSEHLDFSFYIDFIPWLCIHPPILRNLKLSPDVKLFSRFSSLLKSHHPRPLPNPQCLQWPGLVPVSHAQALEQISLFCCYLQKITAAKFNCIVLLRQYNWGTQVPCAISYLESRHIIHQSSRWSTSSGLWLEFDQTYLTTTVDGRNLHELIGSLSHYVQGFIHPRWCKDFFHQQYHSAFIHVDLEAFFCKKLLPPRRNNAIQNIPAIFEVSILAPDLTEERMDLGSYFGVSCRLMERITR